VHRVAYEGGLGMPMLLHPKELTVETIRDFHEDMLAPSTMLMAAIGADHGELRELAEPLFSSGPFGQGAAAIAASTYCGGSANLIADTSVTHVALAFEAKGGLVDAKSRALAAVAKALLDEGRGAQQRRVPHSLEAGVFKTMTSFSHSYKDSGLVGVMGSSSPAQASQLVDAVYKRAAVIASGVSEAQLSAAKGVVVGEHKMSLASLPLMWRLSHLPRSVHMSRS
jgi:predicted Zn-dependent peptidase